MSQPSVFEPTIHYLSAEDRERIHEAALHILERIGMQILHEGARETLRGAGCQLDHDGRVLIPADRVLDALERAPRAIQVVDRTGAPAMDLGGRRAHFGTGSDLMWSIDGATLERHPCQVEDVRRAALVCDALPEIDFVMSFANPAEVDPHRAYLLSFKAMATSTTKPIVTTSDAGADLHEMWRMACELRGGADALAAAPYILHYTEPASPLKHPHDSLEKVLLCADKAIPLVYSPAPMAGATAPITVAGHVALGLAECLTGLVLAQLTRPGAPVLLGMGPAVMDMATAQSSYNAPEYLLSYMAMAEMSHHYDLPSWGYAGTSDSQLPDEQAALEAGLETYMSTVAGVNLNHDVGYLDMGRTGSLEQIVVMDEHIAQVRRMQRGIPVDDDSLALDVIADVGPAGQFLGHAHTMKHFRAVQWRPGLLNRLDHTRWSRKGGLTLRQRASARLAEILEQHTPPALDDALAARLQQIVDAYHKTVD